MRRERPTPLQTRPRVSVVIPCYNYGHYLPDAVSSALDQRDVDVEVLIVDDASTDDSAEVALALAASDPRVDVLLHEQNRGHIQTYNDGLAKVRGDYVVLLSADDVLTTDALTRATALLETHPEVGLVYGRVESFTAQRPRPTRLDADSWTIWRGEAWVHRTCRRVRNMIASPEAVMRRSLLEELGGGYDPDHPHAADMLLWVRAAARMDVGRVNGPAQAGYRAHDTNMHSTTFDGELTDMRHRRSVFDALFEEHPNPGQRALAYRRLSHEAMLAAANHQINGSPAVSFAEFALECDPAISRTRLWRGYQRRAARGAGRAEVAVLDKLHKVRWRVRTARWRRWGT